ncbi:MULTISPECIES: hypothetical protein [Bacillus cereus group]|uniref:hypothetical protein n=1 Tax=Bacillus cereus group TaxID=86661 RepID=UPI00027A0934|nr:MULTISPECIES: hypothetical protein [Bacillus cereus group]EJR13167.1 hypothetical protein II9_04424 [Bacillus cereus MSX-D12]MDA2144846.1 hypothetical protein [Bacillus cereus group sp. Bc248]MDA2172963.1 hypothetical protein [Bacillus cereus group sp. Bc247]QPI82584.1 hypothetical protein I0K14_04945 [Bacillus paranthracis]
MVKKHGPDFNCYKEKKKCNSHKEHKCSEKEEEKCNSQKEHKCCEKEEEKCNSQKEHKCCEKEEEKCNSQKEHKCCEKETCDSSCECKGVVNYFATATNRITVNICPDCKVKDSSVFVQSGSVILKSTSISPPKCASIVGGTALFASGLAEFILSGLFYEGAFTVFLIKRLGNINFAYFTFTGVNVGGMAISITLLAAAIPDANLSITKCNSNGCECGQSDFNVIPNVNLSPIDPKIKAFVHHMDGTIEEIEG